MKKTIISTFSLLFLILHITRAQTIEPRETLSFNSNWEFSKEENLQGTPKPYEQNFNTKNWSKVVLPHTANIEPMVLVNRQWQGNCWYKKTFTPALSWRNKKVFIAFEGAMQVADIWINGAKAFTHQGGYLPFTIDLSKLLKFGAPNTITVKLNNEDNPQVPPGKPLKELDFCYYSGIYRNVNLIITNSVYVTDAIHENKVAGGGVFITYPKVAKSSATLNARVHIRNEQRQGAVCDAKIELLDQDSKVVAKAQTDTETIAIGNDFTFDKDLTITKPRLWHPNHPYLYTLRITLYANNKIVDILTQKTGIRKFEIDEDKKFRINGEPLYLYGTNRHQEYPYIGNALSDNAQYRDARKIKDAGINFLRLSPYPQSPAFLDACDELGIIVTDCIPGWQFFGDKVFEEASYQNAREMIRRDRNHACIATWEVSLNETEMPGNFMKKMVSIASEESPNQKLITSGWIDDYYDIFTPARQHATAPDYWKKYKKSAFLTAEYGDWEYYAQNAGFNQTEFKDLKETERTSRQLRGDGEKRLLQQVQNFQEAHNDNLHSANLGDAFWVMYDYNRGYAPDIESSGVMDIVRLPKFTYYFYQSQRNPLFISKLYNSGAMVKIASYWTPTSSKNLTIYSNCQEVALYLNGKLIERKKAQSGKYSDKLKYPPYNFNMALFKAGTLKAVGYIDGKMVATDLVSTPKNASKIVLYADFSGKKLKADGADAVFVYAKICDAKGNVVSDAVNVISFKVIGNAKISSPKKLNAEAGIATALLQAGLKGGSVQVEATAKGLQKGILKIQLIK